MSRILVVDDEEGIRRSLAGILSDEGFATTLVADGDRALASIDDDGVPDLVLLDIAMPRRDGVEILIEMRERWPSLPVVMMSGHGTVETAVRTTKHGAFDFIEKPFGAQALLGKIQSALACSRERYAQRLEQQAIEARLALLTPRENSVIRLVVAGNSSREISELLGISVRTVENHRTRIMEKLHAESTVELVKLFL